MGPPIKIAVIAHRGEKHKPEDFVPHLESETKHALMLFAAQKVRELYSRADGKSAILGLEPKDDTAARQIVESLPLAQLGMLSLDIYGTKPCRGFVANL